MVSLKRCREILGTACSATDAQLAELRDQLMALADISLEMGRKKIAAGAAKVSERGTTNLSGAAREEIIERAAIMEFEGGFTRPEAEELAMKMWLRAQDAATRVLPN